MERSLVKHGESTLMVSVPAQWIKRHHLEKGDSVNVLDEGESVIILKKGTKKQHISKEIKFKEPDYDEIRAMLCRSYREGVDELVIKYDNEEIFSVVHRIVASILGYEITDSRKGQCIVKNLVNEFGFDKSTSFKKIITLTNNMFAYTRDILTGEEKSSLEKLKLVRDEGCKFRDASFIMLKNDSMSNAFTDAFIIHIFEQNNTYLMWLIKSFEENKMKKVSKDFLKLFDDIHDYFRNAIILMRKKDKEYLRYIMDNRRKLIKQCEKVSAKDEAKLALYLSMLVQNIHNPKSVLIS